MVRKLQGLAMHPQAQPVLQKPRAIHSQNNYATALPCKSYSARGTIMLLPEQRYDF